MELFTKCGRCGALMQTRCVDGGFTRKIHLASCVMTGEVNSDGATAGDEIEHTVLCPDCMGKLKQWLTGESEEPQEAGDSVERLAADMAMALVFPPEDCCGIRIACEYFGHSYNTGCCDRESSRYGDECPASSYLSDCWETMCASIRRRCTALGIDLGGEADAE